MSVTHAYWDVDGVLNAVTNTYKVPKEGYSGWSGWRLIAVEDQPITFSEELIERLNKIIHHPRLESSWLTSWGTRAPTRLAPAIGLDAQSWSSLGYEEMVSWARREGRGPWWKLQVVQGQMKSARGEGLLWMDDEIISSGPALTWLNRRSVRTSKAVAPAQPSGMTRDQVEAIEKFLDQR